MTPTTTVQKAAFKRLKEAASDIVEISVDKGQYTIWSDVDDMRTDAPELPGYYQIFGHSQQGSEPVITEYFACLDIRRAFRLTVCGKIVDLS